MTSKRVHNRNQIYHLVQRNHNKSHLLKDAFLKSLWIESLKRQSRRMGLDVFSYVVMDNHIHIIAAEELEGAIGNTMKSVNVRLTRAYNREYKRSGTIWESRIKCFNLRTDFHLLEAMLYLDFNPVRAKIVNDPREYPYSACSMLCYGEENDLVQHSKLDGILKAAGFNLECYNEWVEAKIKQGANHRSSAFHI